MRDLYCVLAMSLAACAPDPTQLVVVIDSDMAVPDRVRKIQAFVNGAEFDPAWQHTFDVSAGATLPLSFGIGANNAANPVTIVITAIAADETALVSRRATSRFVADKTIVLPMFLAESCAGFACADMFTCTKLGCESEIIDENGLKVIEAGGGGEFD